MFNIFIAYVAGKRAGRNAVRKDIERQRYEDEYEPYEHEGLYDDILFLLGVVFAVYLLIS